jgi:8-oxo-dGTP diphosphatase
VPKVRQTLATAVVIHEDGLRALLHKREDFRVWGLPGGNLKVGETPEEAAIRETFEETGYHIRITELVGEYHRPQFRDLRFVYRGQVVGGFPLEGGPETLAVSWFPLDDLPKILAPSVRAMVRDGFVWDSKPVTRTVTYPVWQVATVCGLLWLRDMRNRLQGRP